MSDRARQFLPFDALKGFKQAIKEREKIKVDKIELSEEMANVISYKLRQVKKGMIIKVIHYIDNEYIETNGIVSEFDETFKYLKIVKKKIMFDDIFDIQSNEIKDYDKFSLIAKKYKLKETEGSDYHGPNVKPYVKLGVCIKEI